VFGILIGGAVPFLFSSFSVQATARGAFEMVNEVRRQFKENPRILEGLTNLTMTNALTSAQRTL
jgi:K(+)-stimulated pyrophosphate-energized sodium pump